MAGVVFGHFWGYLISVIPEKGDKYVVPLRFLALFLGGLFSLFLSTAIGWSGAGMYNSIFYSIGVLILCKTFNYYNIFYFDNKNYG